MQVAGEATSTARTRAGVLSLRIPVSMHDQLIALAKREGISMNSLVGYMLTTCLVSGDRLFQAGATAAATMTGVPVATGAKGTGGLPG
jgi:hypothetical protein